MKVAIIAPDWGNSWLPIYKDLLEEAGHKVFILDPNGEKGTSYDAYIHMWARRDNFIDLPGQHIMFMRRYELFDAAHWVGLPWKGISDLIFCNDWIKATVDSFFKEQKIEQTTHLIYNAVDPSLWTYQERFHGKKIGMACHVHTKKNIPLALQILDQLPYDYELHIAGAVQDHCLAEYICHVGNKIGRKVVIHGQIDRDKLDEWWEDKSYCLSTSLSEGNPNNVLEAMVKGIKPVIHGWPGSESQFPVFYTAREAAAEIMRGNYLSSDYLKVVSEYHSLENYRAVINLLKGGD